MLSLLLYSSAANAALSVPFVKKNAIYRRDASAASLVGDGLSYNIQFKIGGQDMESIIDTGSSDLWVPASDGCEVSEGTTGENADCEYTFNPSDSSSFSANESVSFNITYGDGSAAIGYYAQDTVEIASYTVSQANFALATQASTNSVFGIGLSTGEVSYYNEYAMSTSNEIVNEDGDQYDNFPWQLYRQGITSAAAYSLYLGNPVDYSGELLFGGVDSSKYTGSLYTMPIELEAVSLYSDGSALNYPEPTRFLVAVDKISMTSSSGDTQEIFSGGIPALLDSGSTISTFPSSIASALATAFGLSSYSEVTGCGVEDGTVDITIRGEEFKIPFSTFVRTLHNFEGEEVVTTDGVIACSPGISVDDDSTFFIFGDNILSALYLVYDLENNEIAIAQANTDGGDSDIQDIDSDGIPGATQASGYSSTLTYELSSVRSVDWTVSASSVTTISGDDATRTTYDGSEETGLVRTTTHLGRTSIGSDDDGSSTSSGRSGSGSSSSSRNGAAPLTQGLSAMLLSILALF